ncbi:LPS assembly lipoprotein LptE [Methylomicrobium sp. RS1]|jgi:LPS-assembly lipoprotein|uniref:LPS-assembly lipoprotein LptE n=1 Tax=Candidatus Methylomicrobium oryzae TaxID=2802053 RepID=UPI001F023A4F|nr:LPS assembly lipoprotein LptE [Methylomicrobium sp. RS1]
MKKLFIVLLACWLSACGYHLRGTEQAAVKFKKVYLEGATEALREQFDEVLKLSSARLAKSAKEADLHIKVDDEKYNRRVVSLNFSGRSNQLELSYRLKFQLTGADNAPLPSNEPLLITREFFNDQQDILAKNNEEGVIRREMYRQAVRSILDRAKAQIQAKAK